jgi:thiol-disulfide isomerase/thioredoxin
MGCLAIAIHFTSLASAQSPLKASDTMPDYELINLINHSSQTARLSSFAKRLIILEFWSTTCTSCIEAWPKLIKLQKEFDKEVQIILVNAYQDEKTVRAIFDKRKRLAEVNMSLPTVCGDTVLSKLFPRIGVPHVVWIDNQKVRSLTDGPALTKQSILNVLKDSRFTMPQAWREDPIPVNFDNPLFINGNGGDGKTIVKSSTLASYGPNMISNIAMIGEPKSNSYNKITAVNCTLHELYGFAFSDRLTPYNTPAPLTLNRIRFEGLDSAEYAGYIDGIIQTQNHFLYQIIATSTTKEQMQQEMQVDLKRLFGFDAKMEKRKVMCRVLKVEDSTRLMSLIDRTYLQGVTESNFSFNRVFTFKEIFWDLENLYTHSPTPIVNEAKMKGLPAGVEIETDVKDPDKLDSALRKYGMSFGDEMRTLDILVIKKPKARRR